MMVGTCLVTWMMALTLALPPDDDASALVNRLVTGTVAEREEAVRELETMGRAALPALVTAIKSAGAEGRARILPVWERIQKPAMIRPTLVKIDGDGRPIADLIQSIRDQSGFYVESSQQRPSDLIKGRGPMPIPFWEAADQLGLKGAHFDIHNPSGSHFPTLNFADSFDPGPTMISGPFLIKLRGLHDHRDRRLIDGPWLIVDEINQKIPIARGTKPSESRFFVGFSLMVEPRMWFTQEGPARAIEAIDNLGQSLVLPGSTHVEADHSLFYNGGGITQGDVQLDLAMPKKPGRSITRLRGVVPVALQVRWPVPSLEIALEGSQGKTFDQDDVSFTVRDFDADDQGSRLSLDVRLKLDKLELPPGHDNELVNSRIRCLTSHQVEIVDADGNVLDESGSGSWGPDGTGQIHFASRPDKTKGRATQFRYYRMLRAFTDVAFDFRAIPMP
jgi:hypothetical protein